jgi:hypothetical protein
MHGCRWSAVTILLHGAGFNGKPRADGVDDGPPGSAQSFDAMGERTYVR